jgi:DNA-directed RNA polymerase omega subunit
MSLKRADSVIHYEYEELARKIREKVGNRPELGAEKYLLTLVIAKRARQVQDILARGEENKLKITPRDVGVEKAVSIAIEELKDDLIEISFEEGE